MPAQAAGLAERDRLRSRLPDPALHSRRGEIAAAAATAAVAGQVLLAPVTLALAVAFAAAGRATRWRPRWLALPALTGLALSASSPRTALDGFLAPGRALIDDLAVGTAPSRIAHQALTAATAPGQLPLALLASTAEAGILLWSGRYRHGARFAAGWRPGPIALARGWLGRAALAAGHTVTQSGCAVGIEPGTGRLVTMRWADFETGVLARALDSASVLRLCLPAVTAALRRRMAVLVLDLTPGSELTEALVRLGGQLGVVVSTITAVHATTLGSKLLGRECTVGRGARADLAVLAAGLRGLSDIGIRGDALLWVHGCEEPDAVAALVPLGSSAGVRILLSTCHDAAAAGLAGMAGTTLIAQPDGTASLIAGRPGLGGAEVRYTAIPLRAVTTCR
jgi:hypothetical protein